jgi:hypothetical protein
MEERSLDQPSNVQNMPLPELVRHCQEETQKYFHKGQHVTIYCFELLRLALQVGVSDAFTHVFRNYQPLVRKWVYNHPQFYGTGEAADYFVSAAFSSFYFAVRGERFARFSTLSQLLTYLKRCVHTAIAQYFRGAEPQAALSLDDNNNLLIEPTESYSSLADIWNRITELLPDEVDQLLAHCVFTQNLKPSQIVEIYPHWQSAREISVQLQRIRRRLREDSTLRSLLGLEN